MYYFLISVILLSCTLGPLQTMDTMYVLLPIAVQFYFHSYNHKRERDFHFNFIYIHFQNFQCQFCRFENTTAGTAGFDFQEFFGKF